MEVDQFKFKKVEHFKYLGIIKIEKMTSQKKYLVARVQERLRTGESIKYKIVIKKDEETIMYHNIDLYCTTRKLRH